MRSPESKTVLALRARSDAIVSSLMLAPGASLSMLLEAVAKVTGRRIEIDPVGNGEWAPVTGLVLLSEDPPAARIFIRRTDPRWYQFHSALHEIGHVLFGHASCAAISGQSVLHLNLGAVAGSSSINFEDSERVQEAEAEMLAHRIARVMLGPKYWFDEAALG